MPRPLKIIGIVVGAVVGVLVLAIAVLYFVGSHQINRQHVVPDIAIAVLPDSAHIARGSHLAHAVTGCTECHGADLGGTVMADVPPFFLAAPNITRGKGGRADTLTDVDFERALRFGVRRDGQSLIVMPSETFAHLTDLDLQSIIAFVRSVPAVDRELPRASIRFLGRVLLGAGQFPVLAAPLAAKEKPHALMEPAPTAEYGRYLVAIAGCRGCHGPSLAGGMVAAGKPGAIASANLTPAGRLGTWSEEDFMRTLRTGKKPDGIPLNETMPWKVYGQMTDDELHAIVRYLRTVPRVETPTRK
jgi:cytochrome c553